MSITLRDALARLKVPQLKDLVSHLPGAEAAGRKDEVIERIVVGMLGPGRRAIAFRRFWYGAGSRDLVSRVRAPARASHDGGSLVAALAIRWGGYFTAVSLDHVLSLADQTLLALLLWSAVYVILRDLFRTPASGAENELGAICGYIIAGDAWARINATAYLLVPSAYSINPEVAALLPDWHGRVPLFTYYGIHASIDDRLLGRVTSTRTRDDVEPVCRAVWSVLHGRRRVGVRRAGAVREGRGSKRSTTCNACMGADWYLATHPAHCDDCSCEPRVSRTLAIAMTFN